MNLLTDQLPVSVEIDGDFYEIRHDYAVSVQFEIMMQSDEMTEEGKTIRALELYYPVLPQDPAKAIDRILWFYRCGREEGGQDTHSSAGRAQDPAYSFECDHEYIYAAFLDQYGIDLQRENLHWWTFRALFRSLREDHKIMKIMGYRSVTVTGDMPDEKRAFYREMKKIYRIPQSKLNKQKISAIEEVLLSGGNLKELL